MLTFVHEKGADSQVAAKIDTLELLSGKVDTFLNFGFEVVRPWYALLQGLVKISFGPFEVSFDAFSVEIHQGHKKMAFLLDIIGTKTYLSQ